MINRNAILPAGRKALLGVVFLSIPLLGDDYGFSMDELDAIDTKSYEYSALYKSTAKASGAE